MATWEHLLEAASGSRDGALIHLDISMVEARDLLLVWPAQYALVDQSGAPYDFATIANSAPVAGGGACRVTLFKDGAVAKALTWQGRSNGTFQISATNTETAGLAGDLRRNPTGQNYSFSAELTIPGGTGKRLELITGTMRFVHAEGRI